MIRIAALNVSESCSDDSSSQPEIATKEAQEEEAFSLYNKALQLQNQNEFDKAEEMFNVLLDTDFLTEAIPVEDGDNLRRPNLLLKYSAHKNLAIIASQNGDYKKAMESYLEALNLDSSDVTLWYKIGITALKLHNYPLARFAFEEGVKCNPNHWPCLDNLVTVLYALNDYAGCLYFISQALERDSGFIKGLVFRDKIFQEQPTLRRDTEELFKRCDDAIFHSDYDKEDADKFVEESLNMRKIKHELSRVPPLPVLKFNKPWTNYTWKCLGECLLSLYDTINNSEPNANISLGCKLDLEYYLDPKSLEIEKEKENQDQSLSGRSLDNSDSPVPSLPSNNPSGVSSPQVEAMQEVVAETSEPIATEETIAQQLLEANVSLSDAVLSGGRKGHKRKRLNSLDFNESYVVTKRRSARVRNTGVVKKQENINYFELLQKFLPSSLLAENLDKDRDDEMHLTVAVEKPACTEMLIDHDYDDYNHREYRFLSIEEEGVKKFLSSNIKNSGVLTVMTNYLIALGKIHRMTWPSYLNDVFIAVFEKLRRHLVHPAVLCQDQPNDVVKDDAIFTLLFCEMKLDKWGSSHSRSVPVLSPGSSKIYNLAQYGPDFPGQYYREDLEHLLYITVRKDILGNDWLDYTIRVFWLRARFFMVIGQGDYARDCFDTITQYFQEEIENSSTTPSISLHNCKIDNVVTIEQVQKQLESVQRCQSLEEIQRLYESGEYQQVVKLLTATFNKRPHGGKMNLVKKNPERHAQLQLLQDCFWSLENYQKHLEWGEICFNEAFQHYSSSLEKSFKDIWFETLKNLMIGLERNVRQNSSLLKTIRQSSLVRFAQNLIRIITLQMEFPETIPNIRDGIVYPWILLYYLIDHEEVKIRALVSSQKNENERHELESGVSSSLMLLYNAHEFLGRRSWCCCGEGKLLLLYTDVLVKQLNEHSSDNPYPYKEDLDGALEQCFYCLYGHPHKRRAKHLQDHCSSQISLTWERAVPLFQFFKPKFIPEFDGHKTSTVSAELEHLLRRIITLVPTRDDPANKVDIISSYMEGGTDEIPTDLVDKSVPIVTELYYLLADYYFKNKEFGKAIRFYTLDLCVNTNRLDSWAGVALARSSQLEQKLNSVGAIDGQLGDDDDDEGDKRGQTKCELKNEGAVYRKSTSALRCFKRALELNKNHSTLWIEYGSTAYMLHSHTSRQLKQKEQFCLTPDMMESLTMKRSEMLKIAEKCFYSANQCAAIAEDDEEWLHHYMLGKIAEKLGNPITKSLYHYQRAAYHLHEKEARYPRKIQYHNPPDYAMEALEVFYRMHAAALKYLLPYEKKSLLPEVSEEIYKYLKISSESPFCLFQEKSRCASLNSSDVDEPIAPPHGEHAKQQCSSAITYDHDYFRRKRKDSSTEDSEPEARLRNSVDSSSESMDSVTVKELVNSLVAEVEERCPSDLSINSDVVIVLGDRKLQKHLLQSSIGVENVDLNTKPIISEKSEAGGATASHNQPDAPISPASNKSETIGNVSEIKSGPSQGTAINLEPKSALAVNNVTSAASVQLTDTIKSDAEKSAVDASVPAAQGVSTKSNDADCNTDQKDGLPSNTKPAEVHSLNELIEMCLSAMKQCLQRFPQHYKSLYRLAYFYCYSSQSFKNLHWSRDYLLGRNIGWQQLAHMPCQGLFSERKNTNLFNGIWRIPNEDIDRPGSFGSHMYRSVVLLIEVLKHLKDYNFLINLTLQLHRNPDTGKKFLRDMDRLYLYGLTQDKTMASLKREMRKLCAIERTAEIKEKIVKHMLIIYRAWTNYLKCASNPDMVNKFLEDCYRLYKPTEFQGDKPILEHAIKFCQFQMSLTRLPKVFSMPSYESSKMNLSSCSASDRRTSVTSEQEPPIDPQTWTAEALEKAAKLLLSTPDPSLKMKEKTSELSIKTMKAAYSPSSNKDSHAASGVSSATRELKSANEEKAGSNQTSSNGGKVSWNSSNIPANGMVIGSMTITPIGVNNPPPIAEGLLGRLACSQPKAPLDLTTADQKKTVSPATKASSFNPFDPNKLTADVQSKISSLDPVDSSRASAVSGFQMEFMRKLAQSQQLSISKSPSNRPASSNTSSVTQAKAAAQLRDAWSSKTLPPTSYQNAASRATSSVKHSSISHLTSDVPSNLNVINVDEKHSAAKLKETSVIMLPASVDKIPISENLSENISLLKRTKSIGDCASGMKSQTPSIPPSTSREISKSLSS